MYSDREIKEAKKRVKKKKDFYGHLMVYLAVNLVFLFITRGGWRFVSLFWGIGLASHFFSVFGIPGTGQGSDEWEQQEVEKELRKMKKRNQGPKVSNSKDLDEKLELRQMDRRYDDSDFV
jgi:hypothetical protein